jgi:hypothetical protein
MKMTAKADSKRFQSGANQYAVYLETPERRLRSDFAFANLQDFLPRQAKPSWCALDCAAVSRYKHCLARCVSSVAEDCA